MAGGSRPTVFVTALLLLAACGRAASDDTSAMTAAPDAAADVTTLAPAETTVAPALDATTATDDLDPAPTTTPVATSTTPTTSTTVAPTTTAPMPSVALPDTGPMPTSAFAVVESDLVALDPASGDVQRTIIEFFEGDGVFPGGLELSADRTAAYYTEGYEDSWYDCVASVGTIREVDLETGRRSDVAGGWSPSLSPDGRRLAFVTSGVCVPDPEAPEIWVLTPADRVAVLDLETGARVEAMTATSPVSYADPNAIDWVEFHPKGDLLVGIAAGDVHRVSSTEASIVQEGPVVFSAEPVLPVEVFDDAMVVMTVGDEGATRLIAVDLATSAIETLWESDIFVAVAADPTGNILVVDARATDSGTAGRLTVLALDAFVTDIAW